MAFPRGIFFKIPSENAPDYVKGKVLIHSEDAVEWIKGQNKEWISLDAKVSKEGKPYLTVDEWKPNKQETTEKMIARADAENPKEVEADQSTSGEDENLPFNFRQS